jgi:hypothetical protein
MAETWYPPTDDCPGSGVPVLVNWAGRELRAMRRRVGSGLAWFCYSDGRLEELPPVKEAARWGDEPDAWRPIKPELWKAPLPEPLPTIEPRMWSSRTKFGAVEEAEAADLAREMEHDREAARAGRGRRAKSEPPELQWWLDPSLVKHSPPGKISVREAEGRVMRALIAQRAVAWPHPGDRTFADVLAAAVRTVPTERADATSDGYVFAQPTSADGGEEMLRALSWLAAVKAGDDDHADGAFAIYLRSLEPARSWRQIAGSMQVSHERARQLYKAALVLVTIVANGGQIAGSIRLGDQLEAVREANRRHRIASRGMGT